MYEFCEIEQRKKKAGKNNPEKTIGDIRGVNLDADEIVLKNVLFKMTDTVKKDPIKRARYEEALNQIVIREAFIEAGAERPRIFTGRQFYQDCQKFDICNPYRWYVIKYKHVDFSNITSENQIELANRKKERYYELLEKDLNDESKAVQNPNSKYFKKLILNK